MENYTYYGAEKKCRYNNCLFCDYLAIHITEYIDRINVRNYCSIDKEELRVFNVKRQKRKRSGENAALDIRAGGAGTLAASATEPSATRSCADASASAHLDKSLRDFPELTDYTDRYSDS